MPVSPTYPGVYVEEVPSGVHTITGVATAVAAFVDSFRRGPLNRAVELFSLADYEREFGGLDAGSEAGYAISQFFLNGGGQAVAVRVAGGSPAASTIVVEDGPTSKVALFRARAGEQVGGTLAVNPGTWGDALRLEVDYNTTSGETFNLTVQEVRTAGGQRQVVRSETFRNLTLRAGATNNALEVVNAGSRMVQLDRTADMPALADPPARPAATGTMGSSLPTSGNLKIPADGATFNVSPAGAANVAVTINYPAALTQTGAIATVAEAGGADPAVVTTAAPHGLATGDSVTIAGVAGYDDANGPHPITVTDATHFTLTGVTTAGNGTGGTWSYRGVRDFPGLRPHLEAALRAAAPTNPLLAGAAVALVGRGTTALPYRFHVTAGRGGAFDPAAVLTFTGTTAADLGLAAAAANVQQYALGSGTAGAQSGAVAGNDGSAPDAPALRGVRADKTGLYALEDVDLFNIVCLPAAANLGNDDLNAVYAAAEAYCEEKRAFLLVDIPAAVATRAAMQTWMGQHDSLRHKNAAVYFPRPLVPDPLNGNRLRSVGASGTIAGVYAKTDATRGVWKAPAGIEAKLVNVPDLPFVLTDPENGSLNPLGINCLRRFPVYGHVAWGARTLDGADVQASEWKYVPVRRLALFLEESLFRGTKWVVFEPNDEPLWAQIRLNIGAFMHNLFRQGAFQGKSPREAYLVKCDRETTTQNDIDLGVVNILVAFAPLKPAEFVVLKIQQLAGQIEV